MPSFTPDHYTSMIDRVLSGLGAFAASPGKEEVEAPALLDELLRHPFSRQMILIRNSRRFRSYAVCQLAIREARRLATTSHASALDTARVALALTNELRDEDYPSELINDLRARAWATLGNCRRIRSDLKGAREAFRESLRALEDGSADPLEAAGVFDLLSTLRSDERRFAESVRLTNRAISIYRRMGQTQKLACALIRRGTTLGKSGQQEAAVSSLRRGLESLDQEASPRWALVARHNLALHLFELRRYDEALLMIGGLKRLHRKVGSEVDRIRLRWLEAKVLRGQGRIRKAERSFREVREFFGRRSVPYDAALASLDLAALYCEQGRFAEMKELATEMLPVFRALRIPRETFAALALFARAVEMERVTVGWIGELAAYLERARKEPGLEFRPSGQST